MDSPKKLCMLSAITYFMYSSTSDASCSLPQDLRNKVWIYSYTQVSDSSKKVINLDIKTTTLENSAINLNFQGSTLDDWTCINSLHISKTTTVVVFKSDQTFSKGLYDGNYRLYLCMKLTRITADLYYFYLLSDVHTDIIPKERAFESKDSDPMSSIVCQYTDSPPKIRTLRKQGTNDVLPNDASLCEPWDSACDVDEDPVEKITEYDSDSEEYEPALDLSFPQSPQDQGTLSLNTTFLESLSNKSASQISVSRSSCPHSVVSQISASFQTPGPSDISIARKGGSKLPTKRWKTQEDVFDMQCKMYEKELLKQDKEIERLDLQIDLLKSMKRNPSIPVSPSVNQLLLGSLLYI